MSECGHCLSLPFWLTGAVLQYLLLGTDLVIPLAAYLAPLACLILVCPLMAARAAQLATQVRLFDVAFSLPVVQCTPAEMMQLTVLACSAH